MTLLGQTILFLMSLLVFNDFSAVFEFFDCESVEYL